MENYLDALRAKQNLFFFDEKFESNYEKVIDAFLT